MLDRGTVFQEDERNLLVFVYGWKVVIKRTGDGKEVFLLQRYGVDNILNCPV